MIVSISEAARLAGKSRTTLHRMMDNGDISRCRDDYNRPGIEMSELLRVFPSLRKEQPATQIEQTATGTEVQALRDHIATLERLIEAKDAMLRLLTDQRPVAAAPVVTAPTPTAQSERQRGLLDRLADGIAAALK